MSTILIIDDDPSLLELMGSTLEQNGYTVEAITSGDEALRLIEGNTYDLIITDIIMPGKEGLETIREIKEKGVTTPIIAMSGGGEIESDEYLKLALGLGAVEAFKKPFKNRPFLDAIEKYIAG